MKRGQHVSFWGKYLFFYIIFNLVFFSFSAKALIAENQNQSIQSTAISIQTTGPVIYKTHFFDSPACLVLNFAPQILHSKLQSDINVNRGMVKSIRCNYYGSSNWLKSISFVLLAKTTYQIKEQDNSIFISIINTPGESINTDMAGEFVIKDYMPKGAGSHERREALKAAITFVRIKRQMLRSLTNSVGPSVLVEKRSDDSIRVTAANLTPAQMITTGTRVMFSQPINLESTTNYPKLPTVVSKSDTRIDLRPVSFGLGVVLLTVLITGRFRISKLKYALKKQEVAVETLKKEQKGIEELFLKEEELHKWSSYESQTKTTASQPENIHITNEVFNFPAPPSDIAERRRFPRADIRNSRGILNRALVGSKTQPFKNVKINDISKGGLSFQVKSRETQFKSPTMIKLYFSNSSKPVDLWVKVVWEKEDLACDGKNVGAKFTRVPKETWDKILDSFGHRLG